MNSIKYGIYKLFEHAIHNWWKIIYLQNSVHTVFNEKESVSILHEKQTNWCCLDDTTNPKLCSKLVNKISDISVK